MSSEKTPNLQLHKWQATDYVQRTEFNDNFVKIDDAHKQVTEQLAESKNQLSYVSYKIQNYNILPDTDISVGLQSLLGTASTNRLKKISIPKATYKLSTPINISGDDIELDLNGSTILWEGVSGVTGSTTDPITNVGNKNNQNFGVFNVKGSFGEDINVIEYIPYYEYYMPLPEQPAFTQTIITSKLKLESKDGISVGDFIRLTYRTGAKYTTSTDYTNKSDVVMDIVSQVIAIDGEYLLLDYYSTVTHAGKLNNDTGTGILFSNTDDSASMAKCKKLIPRKNVKVKNFTIVDTIVPLLPENERGSSQYTGSDGDTFVCGVNLNGTAFCEVENVTVQNGKYPAVINRYSYKSKISNIGMLEPSIYGSGEGYTVQSFGSIYSEFYNLYGIRTRHVIDFLFAAFCFTKNAKTSYSAHTPIAIHGAGEHDLTFEDCEGQISLGHGTPFSNIMHNINFYRHKGALKIDSRAFVTGLFFDRCDLELSTQLYPVDILITNSKLKRKPSYDLIRSKKRGLQIESKFIVNNSEWLFYALDSHWVNTWSDYDLIKLNNSNIKITTPIGNRPVQVLKNIRRIEMNGTKISDMSFSIENTVTKDLDFIIDNSEINFTVDKSDMAIFKPLKITNAVVNVFMRNSLFNTTHTTNKMRLARIFFTAGTEDFSNTEFNIWIINNKIQATFANMQDLLMQSSAGFTINSIIKQNIVKNAIAGTYNSTDNIVL